MNAEIEKEIISETIEENGKRKISCAAAFRVASKLNLTVKEIGDYLLSHNIKILSCQLGCFK